MSILTHWMKGRKKIPSPVKVVEGSIIYKEVRPYRKARWLCWGRWVLPLLLLVLSVELFHVTEGSYAVVRLTPITARRSSLVSVVAVPHPSARQSRLSVHRSVQTKTETVDATGTHLQPATAAHGTLLWYNATTTVQTLAAHTRITVTAFLQIETDTSITIPGASPPTPGQAAGKAHVLQAGAQGNIPANTLIDHPCGCGPGISVSNPEPFRGGQDATKHAVLLERDVEGAIEVSQGRLREQGKKQLLQQKRAGEQLIERPCTTQAKPSHPIGSLLPFHSQVQVEVSVTCTALAYDQSDVARKAVASFQALTRPEGPYQLRPPVIHVVKVTIERIDMLHIAVELYGTWVYHIAPRAKNTLLSSIAGTSLQQAQQYLAHVPGIQHVQLECWWLWLPSDKNRIRITLIG
jgi:hypothetical protein